MVRVVVFPPTNAAPSKLTGPVAYPEQGFACFEEGEQPGRRRDDTTRRGEKDDGQRGEAHPRKRRSAAEAAAQPRAKRG